MDGAMACTAAGHYRGTGMLWIAAAAVAALVIAHGVRRLVRGREMASDLESIKDLARRLRNVADTYRDTGRRGSAIAFRCYAESFEDIATLLEGGPLPCERRWQDMRRSIEACLEYDAWWIAYDVAPSTGQAPPAVVATLGRTVGRLDDIGWQGGSGGARVVA